MQTTHMSVRQPIWDDSESDSDCDVEPPPKNISTSQKTELSKIAPTDIKRAIDHAFRFGDSINQVVKLFYYVSRECDVAFVEQVAYSICRYSTNETLQDQIFGDYLHRVGHEIYPYVDKNKNVGHLDTDEAFSTSHLYLRTAMKIDEYEKKIEKFGTNVLSRNAKQLATLKMVTYLFKNTCDSMNDHDRRSPGWIPVTMEQIKKETKYAIETNQLDFVLKLLKSASSDNRCHALSHDVYADYIHLTIVKSDDLKMLKHVRKYLRLNTPQELRALYTAIWLKCNNVVGYLYEEVIHNNELNSSRIMFRMHDFCPGYGIVSFYERRHELSKYFIENYKNNVVSDINELNFIYSIYPNSNTEGIEIISLLDMSVILGRKIYANNTLPCSRMDLSHMNKLFNMDSLTCSHIKFMTDFQNSVKDYPKGLIPLPRMVKFTKEYAPDMAHAYNRMADLRKNQRNNASKTVKKSSRDSDERKYDVSFSHFVRYSDRRNCGRLSSAQMNELYQNGTDMMGGTHLNMCLFGLAPYISLANNHEAIRKICDVNFKYAYNPDIFGFLMENLEQYTDILEKLDMSTVIRNYQNIYFHIDQMHYVTQGSSIKKHHGEHYRNFLLSVLFSSLDVNKFPKLMCNLYKLLYDGIILTNSDSYIPCVTHSTGLRVDIKNKLEKCPVNKNVMDGFAKYILTKVRKYVDAWKDKKISIMYPLSILKYFNELFLVLGSKENIQDIFNVYETITAVKPSIKLESLMYATHFLSDNSIAIGLSKSSNKFIEEVYRDVSENLLPTTFELEDEIIPITNGSFAAQIMKSSNLGCVPTKLLVPYEAAVREQYVEFWAWFPRYYEENENGLFEQWDGMDGMDEMDEMEPLKKLHCSREVRFFRHSIYEVVLQTLNMGESRLIKKQGEQTHSEVTEDMTTVKSEPSELSNSNVGRQLFEPDLLEFDLSDPLPSIRKIMEKLAYIEHHVQHTYGITEKVTSLTSWEKLPFKEVTDLLNAFNKGTIKDLPDISEDNPVVGKLCANYITKLREFIKLLQLSKVSVEKWIIQCLNDASSSPCYDGVLKLLLTSLVKTLPRHGIDEPFFDINKDDGLWLRRMCNSYVHGHNQAMTNNEYRPTYSPDVIRYVVEKLGADMNASDQNGPGAPLRLAASRGFIDIVKVLHKLGDNLHRADSYGDEAPLRYATLNGHFGVMEYILDNGGNINVLSDYLVHWSAKKGHLKQVEYLLGKGANVKAVDIKTLKFLNLFEYAKEPKYTSEECVIMLMHLEPGDLYVECPNKHPITYSCWSQWAEKKEICPYCTVEADMRTIYVQTKPPGETSDDESTTDDEKLLVGSG